MKTPAWAAHSRRPAETRPLFPAVSTHPHNELALCGCEKDAVPLGTDKGTIQWMKPKTLHNSTVDAARKNVGDLVTYGNGDTFQLICKASSKAEGWMKSTKAMEILGLGCVVQVTTQQGDQVAEALTFVPGAKIELIDGDKANGRRLMEI